MSLLFRFLCGIARNMPLKHYKLNRCNSIVCKHSRAAHVLRRIYSSETLIIRQAEDFIFGQACILGLRKRLSMEENAQKFQRPIAQNTLDQEEVNKFSLLAELWWDEAGEFEALHSMNELRVPLIRDALINKQSTSYNSIQPLKGLRILDVGSGGGILSEPLARLGAFVIGLDASEENIRIAQAHMIHNPRLANSIKYIQATVEDLVTEGGTFDAVIASEVIEHVADAPTFVSACCQLVKPGGSIFFTTLNKTYLSYGLGIVAAENFLKLVPPGTHDWNKFIPPEELQYMLDKNNFSTHLIHGMMYNPLTKRWSWIQNTSVNYAIHALRATDSRSDSYQEKTFDSYSSTKKT